MPKQKTNRAAAKRFKKTANGGFKSGAAYTSHRFHGKTKKQRRQLRGTHMMDSTNVKTYKKLLAH
ncbi:MULTISPECIES: 50S ribosomal protein L35 [Lentilactobacillus]|uniref:Large ribosomal subunit protein bL35 n=2 Tax=Lentilactobacillus TaxID=2767893 RepID=A0A401FKV5_9LACO|nr:MULTISPECIES: 50S ribosomal protein L35 [Lentilactobacillus]MCZ0977086.1 50S ribosomal protein L35 [Lentilactobacillus sp. SPB1-3]GAY72841.1 LSU ribosomal protein L35p [Lentilactobacillus kosonis]